MRPAGKFLIIMTAVVIIAVIFGGARGVLAQPLPFPEMELHLGGGEGNPEGVASFLQLLLFLSVLSLAPAFVVLMTSFTRIVIVLSFVRSALSTHQTPPSQVLIGLALFMTVFVMYPTWEQVNEEAVKPYLEGEITQEEALEKAKNPVAEFMYYQTREKDLALFIHISQIDMPENKNDVPLYVLVPSFVTSELKTAFQMGFILFIPFLVIDMVVASTLMSMGMFMLPPVIISLPFKILLFVLVDGWHLVVKSLLQSFS